MPALSNSVSSFSLTRSLLYRNSHITSQLSSVNSGRPSKQKLFCLDKFMKSQFCTINYYFFHANVCSYNNNYCKVMKNNHKLFVIILHYHHTRKLPIPIVYKINIKYEPKQYTRDIKIHLHCSICSSWNFVLRSTFSFLWNRNFINTLRNYPDKFLIIREKDTMPFIF